MKIFRDGKKVTVTDIAELGAGNRGVFQSALDDLLGSYVTEMDIDLSHTGFLDCGGVGALVALRKSARRQNTRVAIRLLNPTSSAQRLFQLTGLDRLFPIEQCC
jgi:anti-anti-sigma factor